MPQFKVVITDFSDPDHSLEVEEFQASGLDLELVRLDAHTAEALFPAVFDADALLVQWAKITRPVIDQLTRCKVISRYGIGVDMVTWRLPANTASWSAMFPIIASKKSARIPSPACWR